MFVFFSTCHWNCIYLKDIKPHGQKQQDRWQNDNRLEIGSRIATDRGLVRIKKYICIIADRRVSQSEANSY